MVNHRAEVAHHIEQMAAAMEARAVKMRAYGHAVRDDESFEARLGGQFGAVESVMQMQREVAEHGRAVDVYQFERALFAAFAEFQRGAVADAYGVVK